ncbi:hypothetical protein [Oceanisphaera psychrotolerans]|nr:hypothetical protein [Oceanisphaera psychrotolerans]
MAVETGNQVVGMLQQIEKVRKRYFPGVCVAVTIGIAASSCRNITVLPPC